MFDLRGDTEAAVSNPGVFLNAGETSRASLPSSLPRKVAMSGNRPLICSLWHLSTVLWCRSATKCRTPTYALTGRRVFF